MTALALMCVSVVSMNVLYSAINAQSQIVRQKEAIEFFHSRYRHVVIACFFYQPHIQTSLQRGTEATAAVR